MDTGKTIDREALQTEFALGLIAGEGSFYVTFAKDDRRRYGVAPGLRLGVQMGQFSEPLLHTIQDHFGLGSVTEQEDGYSWTVSSREECHSFHSHIEAHLAQYDSIFEIASKSDAYLRWQEALGILAPGVELTKGDLIALANIKGSINKMPNGYARSSEDIIRIIEDHDE